MSKPKPKFYVVWRGHKPGVYTTWGETSLQVSGYAGAEFKSFATRGEAEAAFQGAYATYAGQKSAKPAPRTSSDWEEMGVILDSIAVDAACAGNPGVMEYRGVETSTGAELFHVGPLEEGTNNVGEFLALVHALAMLKKMGRPVMPIYSDSKIAQGWIRQGMCATKLEQTQRNRRIFELIDRGEEWLRENRITNPILKWDTDNWGEIPADFGRK